MKTVSKLYKVIDFLNWSQSQQLVTNPHYQRNLVWPDKAKSYLIDSLIKGYPIPHIFLSEEINPQTMKTIREVVDGQQRISTILQFVNNSFTMLKIHNEEMANTFFQDLADDQKENILSYEIPCQVFSTKDKNIIYDIFARLNTFNYALNSQELRNANYFGAFKTIVEKIRLEIFDELDALNLYKLTDIKRMKVQEDIARILMFFLEGYVVDSDSNINKFYEKYDNDEELANSNKTVNAVVNLCLDTIGIFKKIINFNSQLLSFDRKYYFTMFILIKELKTINDNQIAKLAELDRNIFITKTKNKKYSEEKQELSNNIKEMCEKIIELHTQGTTDPKRKQERISIFKDYIK